MITIETAATAIVVLACLGICSFGALWRRCRAHDTRRQTPVEHSQAPEQFTVMCHEMRTPLNAVIGFSTLALESELAPLQREHVRRARDAGQHLLHLVSNTLDLGKLRSGQLQLEHATFELQNALEQVIDLTSARASAKDIPLCLEVAADVPRRLVGDRLRLTEVLLNFVDNAIKFTHRGVVQITVTLVRREPEQAVLRFCVADTGIGLSADDLLKIFEPYRQAGEASTGRYGGTGLGLSIAKQLVLCMGGSVSVQSRPGMGSEFSFTARFQLAWAPHALSPVHG